MVWGTSQLKRDDPSGGGQVLLGNEVLGHLGQTGHEQHNGHLKVELTTRAFCILRDDHYLLRGMEQPGWSRDIFKRKSERGMTLQLGEGYESKLLTKKHK